MKNMKILFGILAFTLAMLEGVHAQFAYTTNADNTLTITGYSGPSGVVSIPSNINEMTVTSIGTKAFFQTYIPLYVITGVTIPSTVKSIGDFAFFSSGL